MVQSFFIFALGFLAAALLALMAAPAVWSRAVYLTRRRIEAALPLTANELNAEKDALRAEHAMEMRRVEVRHKDMRETLANVKVTAEKQANRIEELEKRLAASIAKAAKFESEIGSLSGKVHERTTEISELAVLLESARTELEIRTSELNAALEQLGDSADHAAINAGKPDGARSEADPLNGDIDALYKTINGLKAASRSLEREVRESNADGRTVSEMLTAERKRSEEMEARLEQSTARIAELEKKLLSRARSGRRGNARDSETLSVEARAIEAENALKKREREIGELSSRLKRLTAAFGEGGKDPEAMAEELGKKMARLSREVKSLEMERDSLKVELATASIGNAAASEAGDAILREKLNKLAAEVVAMAAKLEGPDSRINQVLNKDKLSPPGDVLSLAERIKALQRNAGAAQNA